MKYLRTAQVARSVGVHPNTIRLYEAWGFLPTVERSPGGYRLYTEVHREQARLVWLALRFTWLGGELRQTALGLIQLAREGCLHEALHGAERVLALVRAERQRAEQAVQVVEEWVAGSLPSEPLPEPGLPVRRVAVLLDVTPDMLRNWERNGLLTVPRDPGNGYRVYGPAEIQRLQVIRALSRAKYGTQAILRMMLRLDQGRSESLRAVLNTPDPPDPGDESLSHATDRWLSTLSDMERHGISLIAQVKAMIQAPTPSN